MVLPLSEESDQRALWVLRRCARDEFVATKRRMFIGRSWRIMSDICSARDGRKAAGPRQATWEVDGRLRRLLIAHLPTPFKRPCRAIPRRLNAQSDVGRRRALECCGRLTARRGSSGPTLLLLSSSSGKELAPSECPEYGGEVRASNRSSDLSDSAGLIRLRRAAHAVARCHFSKRAPGSVLR